MARLQLECCRRKVLESEKVGERGRKTSAEVWGGGRERDRDGEGAVHEGQRAFCFTDTGLLRGEVGGISPLWTKGGGGEGRVGAGRRKR